MSRTSQPPPDEAPDARYTLANERTFLAWTRTSLTFLAAAVAFDQLTPGDSPRWMTVTVTAVLAVLGLASCLAGLVRWRRVNRAIRQDASLPATSTPYLLAIGVAVVAVAVLIIAVESGS
jgi:putative membrane protein